MRIGTEALLAELQRLADDLGRSPKVMEMEREGKYSYETYQERFGSWHEALDAADLDRPGSNFPISDDQLLKELRRLADEHGSPPTIEDVRNRSGIPSTTYTERFDSFEAAVSAAGFDPTAEKDTPTPGGGEPQYTKAELAEKLQALADELGHSPTTSDVTEHLNHSVSTFLNYFDASSWDEVLEAAGLDPDEKRVDRTQVSTEELFAEIDRLAEEYTDPPTLQEYRDHAKYSIGLYRRRFGTWNETLEAAGYDSRGFNKISEEDLLKALRDLGEAYDPDEINRKVVEEEAPYSERTYRRRFDSIGDAIDAAGLRDDQEANTESEATNAHR